MVQAFRLAGEMEKTAGCDKGEEMTANTALIPLQIHGDDRGSLIALENGHNLPFDVKRVYYIYGTESGVSRGFHAHKKLRQMLIAVSGSVEIHCEMHSQKTVYLLDTPDKALLVEGMVWHTMEKFSPDCVLMVLADDYYDENDYVRDYAVFKQEDNA